MSTKVEKPPKRSSKNRKPLGDAGNPPQLQQERVQACVYEEFSDPSANTDAETLLNGAKRTLTNAIPSVEMHEYRGQKVFANDKGLTILESLDQLKSDVRELRTRLDDTQSRLDDTQSRLDDTQSELRSVQRMFYNTRERTYLTYLRNFWDDFGVPRYSSVKKTPQHKQVAQRVNMLNSRHIHAGDSESDAAMFIARQPFKSDKAFKHLYALSALQINEIASLGYRSVIQVLDFAGTVHYQGRHMASDEQIVFDKIMRHVHQRKFVEAEEAAEAAINGGQFSAGYVQEGEEDM